MSREYPDYPRVGVGAVILHADNVLLVRRGQAPSFGKWSLPGGLVELGETTREAIAREILEECGIKIRIVDVAGVLDRVVKNDAGRSRPPQNLRSGFAPRAEPGHHDATAVGVRVGDVARLRGELLGVEHPLELPLRGAIETRQALRQLRLADVEPDDERVGGDLFEPLGDDLDFHPRVPPLKVSARRIMSRRPWVVSSSASRPSSNHCASAASSPAWTSSESGYAR